MASVTGCSSLDVIYIREGIGSNLYSSDLPDASYLQDVYVGEICRQAGLRVLRQGDVLLCDEVGMRPSEWATFVQAGMNDIDRRCDAYLTWLDDKRRSREPVLSEIATTSATTAAILGLTGVGATPIAIVGAAFGFAKESFINFQSRLLTYIDQAVVQSVVLSNQSTYRTNVIAQSINNRPAAIYLLRGYLRLCMPMSIEMHINNTMTVFQRGGAQALSVGGPILMRTPEVAKTAATGGATVIRAVFRPDDASAILEKFLDPDGAGLRRPDRVQAVTPFLTRIGLRARDLTRFLNGSEFATQRRDLVNELKSQGKL